MTRHKIWTAAQVRGLGVTTDVATAASVLGISRSTGYDLARHNQFPVPVLHIRGRIVIPVAGLIAALRLDKPPTDVTTPGDLTAAHDHALM